MIPGFEGLAPGLVRVEQAMNQALTAREPKVAGLIADLGRFHGKMLRPVLVLAVADALGGAGQRHEQLAASVELIHTATLIHDDLIDDANIRRGMTTAHVRWGNTTSVLLGDFFYTRAFHLVASLGDPWATLRLTETTDIVCEGELHQQVAARDVNLSEAEYYRIIYAKTAVLTELAGELGALDAGPAVRQAAGAYGRACGLAFQIIDDCLDLTGDPQKVGKTLLTDIERGRLTLPFLRLLAESTPEARTATERLLLGVGTTSTVEEVRQAVLASGALASALASARSHAADAIAAIAAFPAGAARDRLERLASFIVDRDF